MSFSVNVDLANPGQFFACCGLFELADRLDSGKSAEACFDEGHMRIRTGQMLGDVLDYLADCSVSNTMMPRERARFQELTEMTVKQRKLQSGAEDEQKQLEKLVRESPIVLKGPIDFTIDWFTDDFAGGSRFKTWAGRQSVLEIASAMKRPLEKWEWRDERCLSFSVAGCGVPFNFDSDLGAQGGALDIGFSFDPLSGSSLTRIETTARPVLELLAFIGLQRFRPRSIGSTNRFLYSAWKNPLPISVAGPAACGLLPVPDSLDFEFKLLYRTKYLKSFLPAIPFSGVSDE